MTIEEQAMALRAGQTDLKYIDWTKENAEEEFKVLYNVGELLDFFEFIKVEAAVLLLSDNEYLRRMAELVSFGELPVRTVDNDIDLMFWKHFKKREPDSLFGPSAGSARIKDWKAHSFVSEKFIPTSIELDRTPLSWKNPLSDIEKSKSHYHALDNYIKNVLTLEQCLTSESDYVKKAKRWFIKHQGTPLRAWWSEFKFKLFQIWMLKVRVPIWRLQKKFKKKDPNVLKCTWVRAESGEETLHVTHSADGDQKTK